MSRQDHAAPILTRLGAATGSAPMVVYDGKVPDGTPPPSPPYSVVRFAFRALTADESPNTTSLTFDSETYQVDVTVHSVGDDARATRAVASRAETQLLNWTPVVPTRTCTPLRQIDSVTLPPNEAMGVSVEQQSDTYRFLSQPG